MLKSSFDHPPGASAAPPLARLHNLVSETGLRTLESTSDAAACLLPLLDALGWDGDAHAIAEALPHFTADLDIDDICAVLASLGFVCTEARCAVADLDPRLLPALFVADDGAVSVILDRDDDGLRRFDGRSGETVRSVDDAARGTVLFFSRPEPELREKATASAAGPWLSTVLNRFRGLFWQLFAVSTVIGVLSLTVPLFILAVYDWVIPARTDATLFFLAGTAAFAIGFDAVMRMLRGRMLAHIAARVDRILVTSVFAQILSLPITMSERATVGAQVARIRQMEGVRDLLGGPIAGVALDLPFLIPFIALMAWLAGPLAFVLIVTALLFAVAAVLLMPKVRRLSAERAEARSARQALMMETLTAMRWIKAQGADDIWRSRFRDVSARSAVAGARAAQLSVVVETIGHVLMLGAGIAVLAWGARGVLEDSLSVGALVASMALAWRTLGPLQQAFVWLPRLDSALVGARRLNALMRLRPERQVRPASPAARRIAGAVTLQRVGFRYSPVSEPALLGVSANVAPGQIIAITGPGGSGKSTLLKLVAGLYTPQAGAVLVDGVDVRQLDPAELRRAIAYVPQVCHLFYGTIAQNLLLADPTATDEALRDAARDAAVLDEILALPHGFETRLTERLERQLAAGFRQRLMLARAYVKRAPILILDDAGKHLDRDGDAAFLAKLRALRGAATVFLATHRPSHIGVADRVIYLEHGHVVFEGVPKDVLARTL